MTNYIIIDAEETNLINFDEVKETSLETLVYSLDKTKTFINWEGDEPSFVSNLQSKSIIYNNDEMIEIMKELEWTPPFN